MENCDEKAKVLASKYLFKKPWLNIIFWNILTG